MSGSHVRQQSRHMRLPYEIVSQASCALLLVPNDDLQTVCFGRGDLHVSGMLGTCSGMMRAAARQS